jgi:hypothetical protein
MAGGEQTGGKAGEAGTDNYDVKICHLKFIFSFKTFKPFKTIKPPPCIPRDAGEESLSWATSKKGGGLNGAKRLNGLNDLNKRMVFHRQSSTETVF